ncbi:MAG: hypothetical protein HY042_13120 [Spirochaetia bacterium]|nr:hypothetical protein [Spirochaetia bacterium]
MDDLNQNVYHPTEGAFQRAPDSSPQQGFGKFDFGRAMSLGMDAYKEYVGLGAGSTVVWWLLILGVYILSIVLVGLVLLPAAGIGPMLLGYYMVKRRADMGILFRGFSSLGRVLGAALLMGLIFLPVILVAMGPLIGAIAYNASKGDGNESAGSLGAIGIAYLFLFMMIPIIYYIMGRMILVFPLITERGYGSVQAIRTSWDVTRPYQWWLMLLYFVTEILAQVGVYLLCVGVLFTMPMSQAFRGAAIYMLLGEDNPVTPGGAVEQAPFAQGPSPSGTNPYS